MFFKVADWTKFFHDLLDKTATLVVFNLNDYFPWMGVFRRSMHTKAGKLIKRWDDLLDRLIADHEAAGNLVQQEEPTDLIGALLAHQHEYVQPLQRRHEGSGHCKKQNLYLTLLVLTTKAHRLPLLNDILLTSI